MLPRFGQCYHGNRLVSRSFSFKINLRFQPYLKQLLALNMQVNITSYIWCNAIAKFETKINLPAMVVVEITTLNGDGDTVTTLGGDRDNHIEWW